jgi:thiol:disulfide interchange protein
LTFTVLASFGLGALLCLGQHGNPPDPQSHVVTGQPSYVPVHTYDPARDAGADIAAAIAEAQKTGKRILLDIGGNWCPWCHTLDQFFQQHPDVLQLRDANFIVVNVYYGSDNKNDKALSRYPKVLGIPHFFVLDKDGTLLHSEHILDLKIEGDYSPTKMKEFLMKWSPAAANVTQAESK